MSQLELHAAGLVESERHELPEGTTLLVGRNPEARSVPGIDAASVTAVAVRSPSVSTNHVLAWREHDATVLRDLQSRNGTWLRLPTDGLVRVESELPLCVQLATAPAGPGSLAEPADAAWTGRADYAQGVSAAVKRWGAQQGLELDASLVAGDQPIPVPGYPGHLPLADGNVLEIGIMGRTVDHRSQPILRVLWRYLERQNALFAAEEESRAEGLILASEGIRNAHRQVYDAAARGARCLLLLGPSGAGKEGLARCFHRYTGRSGAFVARNCAMFSRDLLRAELFGAEVGAFTGATRRIVGAVERAQGGTIFLDEIGELGSELQPMLLRFLDSGEYEPLGRYGHPTIADARVVAATSRDLRAATRAGEFRPDLWYRLSVQVVVVPPLKERPKDIVAFLQLHPLPSGTTAWEALTPEARQFLLSHAWEGNFRELMNFVAQLPLSAAPHTIDPATCRHVLQQISLGAPPQLEESAPVVGLGGEAWARLAVQSLDAYREDLHKPPETWDDVKLYMEKYLKPLLFAHLGGLTADETLARGAITTLTRRLQTDRNTVAKQLARYQERFPPK